MRWKTALIGAISLFVSLPLAAPAFAQDADTLAKVTKDKDGDDEGPHSKNPIKKVQGNWSWLNHNKNGCTETVYALSDKKEDIYSRPSQSDDTDDSADTAKPKVTKPTHKVVNVDFHQKDGILFLISASSGKRWLSAYRFVDDDTLIQQTIYLDDGHQYTPFAGDMPKWNEVSVQDGEDQLVRCNDEAEAVINAVENPDDKSGSGSSLAAPSAVPASENTPDDTTSEKPDPSGGLNGSYKVPSNIQRRPIMPVTR